MNISRLVALTATMLFATGAVYTSAQESSKTTSEERGNETAGAPAARSDVGGQAPDFTLKVLGGKGKTLNLASLKGKAVLVNFWATYCDPCKIEMPWLVELQTKYGPQGLQIVGISMDDVDEKTVAAFTRKIGVNYPVLMGTEKVADLYGGIEGLPMSFFLDRDGKIVDRVLGLEDESLIEASIKKSLGDANSSNASAK